MGHIVEIIAVGTELLLGGTLNTDAQMLSKELSPLGLNVYYHSVVGDNPQRLRKSVEHAKKRADIIISTGGLGPTCDDLTKNVLAAAFHKKLVMHRESARRIQAYFDRLDRKMTENNMNQAMLPEGCTVLQNDWGTAPGCAFEAEGKYVVMLPGPPSECLPMFRAYGIPWLSRLSEGMIVSHSLRIFGMGESAVETMLRGQMNRLTNPTLAPYAKTGEVELRITAKAQTKDEAETLIQPVEEEIRQVLGDYIYGKDVENLETLVVGLMKQKGASLSCAESCTGGLFAKRVTDVPGASQVFRGGIVSYTNEVKHDLLGVERGLLEEKSAVSPEAAEAMAAGARDRLHSDYGVSFTGVAGPGPDGEGHPEGLVYAALAGPEGVSVRCLHLGQGRERIRNVAVNHGLDMLRRALSGLPEPVL